MTDFVKVTAAGISRAVILLAKIIVVYVVFSIVLSIVTGQMAIYKPDHNGGMI